MLIRKINLLNDDTLQVEDVGYDDFESFSNAIMSDGKIRIFSYGNDSHYVYNTLDPYPAFDSISRFSISYGGQPIYPYEIRSIGGKIIFAAYTGSNSPQSAIENAVWRIDPDMTNLTKIYQSNYRITLGVA